MSKYKVDITGINTSDIKVLSNEEMVHLFVRYRDGDIAAKEELINGNLKLVLSILRSFNRGDVNLDDLFQVGVIGLIKAIDNFDLSYGLKLSTYAVPLIVGEIKRYIRDDGPIKISRSIKELSIKIVELQKDYFNKKGEEITINKLCEELKVPKEDILLALESTNSVDSIENATYTNNKDGNTINLIEKLSNNKNEQELVTNKLAIYQMINNLENRDKEVILLRYYKEKTQTQVAKILGITQVQVSRIERKILDKMRKQWNMA